MKLFIEKTFEKLRLWTLKWAHSPHMVAGLFFIAFIEASFFPIPPDVLVIAILLINAERWVFYAFVTTAGSVLGALFGYLIGWAFYESVGQQLVTTYGLQTAVDYIGAKYAEHTFLTVFTAAFTPIPFKVVTIAAGLFKVNIFTMFTAAVVGRGIRYFVVAYSIKLFGKKINSLVYKYFNIFSLVVVIVVIGLIIFLKAFN